MAGGSAAEAGVGAASAAALSAALSAAAGMLSWSSNRDLRLTSGAAAKSSNNQTMICSIVHNTSATNFNSSIPASPS